MSATLEVSLLFIDGPLTLALRHATAQEVRDAYNRLGQLVNTYCANHARPAIPSCYLSPFPAIVSPEPDPSLP